MGAKIDRESASVKPLVSEGPDHVIYGMHKEKIVTCGEAPR
jgi:hypothetical protein